MDKDRSLGILVMSPQRFIYEGKASHVILPGEKGVFEVLPYHKRLLSRLLPGYLVVDNQAIKIKRGVVKVGLDQVTVIVEEA